MNVGQRVTVYDGRFVKTYRIWASLSHMFRVLESVRLA